MDEKADPLDEIACIAYIFINGLVPSRVHTNPIEHKNIVQILVLVACDDVVEATCIMHIFEFNAMMMIESVTVKPTIVDDFSYKITLEQRFY